MEKINKALNIIKTNKWIHYAIIITIGIIMSVPLCNIQIRDTHDGCLHFLRMFGTINTFKIGQFPPIVAPYFCNGGGYAMNLFYNPLVTYIPLIIKLIVPSYLMSLKIFAAICIILSGVTMYQFTYHVTQKRTVALFSAIVYILSPYKLGDVYRRYAIGEFASFIFMPILFTGIFNLFNEDGKRHYLIAIGAAGLLLTHTITTFYMAIFCAFYVLFNIKKIKNVEIIRKIFIDVIFILLITALFTLPLIEARMTTEYTIFDSKIMSTNGPYVYAHTLKINDFFAYTVEKQEDTVYCIGLPIFILMLCSVYTYKKVDKRYKDLFVIFMFYSIISLYMCTKYCPWMLFPSFLCKLQYPWRMLGFYNFFISIIIGLNIDIIVNSIFKKDLYKFTTCLLLIVLMTIYTLPIINQFKTNDDQLDYRYENYILNNKYVKHFYINRDYLPKKALLLQRTYLMEKDYNKIYILDGTCDISNEEKEDLTFKANMNNYKKESIIEFPFFYYPGYVIHLVENNQLIKLESMESQNGFLSTKIDKDIDDASIIVEYKGTIIIKAAYIISLLSTIAFIIYVAKKERDIKIEEKNAKIKQN